MADSGAACTPRIAQEEILGCQKMHLLIFDRFGIVLNIFGRFAIPERDDQPVRASKKSVEWLMKGVEKCWESKKQFYDIDEMDDAIAAYDHARKTYQNILAQTISD